MCGHCRQQQAASKQLSIRRLPPLLALHVKRFEGTIAAGGMGAGLRSAPGGGGAVRKLQAPLHFPTGLLDMAPFTSTAILRWVPGGCRVQGGVYRRRLQLKF